MYVVHWVAGKRDGEILETFNNVGDAVNFASDFSEEHKNELDEICGGVAIIDEEGMDIGWEH